MDISILREFIHLSHDLNFTQTAQRCFISQSVLSRHIKALEEELDCKLFVRDKSGVELTPAGAVFAEGAKIIVDTYDSSLNQIRDLSGNYSDILRISYNHVVEGGIISQFYERQLQLYPDVKVELFSTWEERANTLLRQGKVDLAVVSDYGDIDSDVFGSLVLRKGAYMLLVPAGDPLMNRRMIELSDLEGRRMLIPTSRDDSKLYQHLSEAFAVNPGIEVKAAINDPHDNIALVRAKRGLAVVHQATVDELMLDDVQALPLAGELFQYKVSAVWKKAGISSALQGCIDILEGIAAEGIFA